MNLEELEAAIRKLRMRGVAPSTEVRMVFDIDDFDFIDRTINDVVVKEGVVVLEG